MLGLRGAVAPDAGLIASAVARDQGLLTDAGRRRTCPLGVDIVEPPMLFELQRLGMQVVDGQQVMLDARQIKSPDEIMLLTTAAAMVDGVYQDIAEALKPGIRENEIVALANKRLYEMGSDDVEAINAVSGERCSPHPHNFSDRLIRPGDQAFFDIIQSFNGYRTCYYRTFTVGSATPAQRDAYTRRREWIDAAIELVKPGATTDRDRAGCGRAAHASSGSPTRWRRSACSSATASASALHERPIISRLNSLEHPIEIRGAWSSRSRPTARPATASRRARIEEELVVTATAREVITLFPAEELSRRQPVLSTEESQPQHDRTTRLTPTRLRRRMPAAPIDARPSRIPPCALPHAWCEMRAVREARLRPVHAEPGQGHQPPVARAGGDRGRLRRGDAPGRLHVRDLPRTRAHAGARRADDAGAWPSCSAARTA